MSRGSRRFARRLEIIEDAAGDDREVARAVAQAQEGSRDAVRYLYCRYADSVYGYVRTIVGDEHEAEDVTHSVFAKVITRIGTYQPRTVPFSAWLLRVARNAAFDHLRQRRAEPAEDIHATEEQVDLDPTFNAGVVYDAMAELTDDQRRVIFLRHVAGLTPPEIASRTGTTESAVHGLHHRGRLALRRALESRGARPSVLPPPLAAQPSGASR